MWGQRVNRSDPEKLFMAVYNGSGATLTANYAAWWDCEMTTPNGVQVTNSGTSTTLQTFAGIVDSDIANGAYGRVQVFGYRANVAVLSSTGSSVKGDNVIAAAGANALTVAATTGTGKAFGFLCAAITASSSSQFATTANMFIRAL